MSVLITHNPQVVKYASFGESLEEAKSNAEQSVENMTNNGSYAELEFTGDRVGENYYGWLVKSNDVIRS